MAVRPLVSTLAGAIVVIGGAKLLHARQAEAHICTTFYIQHDNCLDDMSVECENRGCPETTFQSCVANSPHAGWMKVECGYVD